MSISNESQNVSISSSKKTPKLIHCGDGVIEEYSSDEEEIEEIESNVVKQKEQVDVKSLNWLPWFKYHVLTGASKSLSACDYMGEKLAWWFGITKPKYLYEIEEFKRMQREQEENSDTEEIELHYGTDLKEIRVVEKPITSLNQITAQNLFQSEN